MEFSEHNIFDFSFISQIRACSVSGVASGVFFYVGKSICSSKAVRRGPGSPTRMYLWENGLLEVSLGVVGELCIINGYL